MTTTKGLTSHDTKTFKEILTKANDEQIRHLRNEIVEEDKKRTRIIGTCAHCQKPVEEDETINTTHKTCGGEWA